jgi:hypothetical protein
VKNHLGFVLGAGLLLALVSACTEQPAKPGAAPAAAQPAAEASDDDVTCVTEAKTGSMLHMETNCTSSASRSATQSQINDAQRMPGR